MLTITVPGRPVPAVRQNRNTRSERVSTYKKYKEGVGTIAKNAMQLQGVKKIPMGRRIEVHVKVWVSGNQHGDTDNYYKALTDALNKIVYDDDKWIFKHSAEKFIVNSKDLEKAEIIIKRMESEIQPIEKDGVA